MPTHLLTVAGMQAESPLVQGLLPQGSWPLRPLPLGPQVEGMLGQASWLGPLPWGFLAQGI